MTERFDDAVVGAGILGLAHAYHLARRGRKVLVFERGPRAQGASVRNFGMLWPIGQPAGAIHRMASRSMEIWRDVLRSSGLWHDPVGSLHLAYREDEAQVLREFAAMAPDAGYECRLLSPRQVLERAPMVKDKGLIAGLWSPSETCVDPREVVANLPGWLETEYGVRFEFGQTVVGFHQPWVLANGRGWYAKQLFLCSGDDLQTLFSDALGATGAVRCKLQMMRSEPLAGGRRIGPMLAGGLTLRHYRSFADCPSLPALKQRVAEETPEFDRFGIHVMASQNGRGEVVIGDSHEYGEAIDPFDKSEIDEQILRYLGRFLDVPELRIASRWHGTYLKHPTESFVVLRPAPGATAVTAVGGAGMTLSFGLAEQVVRDALGEEES